MTKKLFSVINKNSNCKILTKNLVTVVGLRMRNYIFAVHWKIPIFRGVSQKKNVEGKIA